MLGRRSTPPPPPPPPYALSPYALLSLDPIDYQLLALVLLLVLLVLVAAKLTGIHALLLPDAAPPGLAEVPRMLARKARLVTYGSAFLFFSKDKVSSKQLRAAQTDDDLGRVEREVRVLFVRHGESMWNYVFNRGFKPSFLWRWLKTTLRELYLLPYDDSAYLDSPLSDLGVQQCQLLRAFLRKPGVGMDPLTKQDFESLTTGEAHSLVVSSQLRRAASTIAIALSDRLGRSKESVVLVSSLQEISRNFDTLALAPRAGTPELEGCLAGLAAGTTFDGSANHGNKSFAFTGIKRLQSFAEWAADRPETTIVVGGHSLWFKNFFNLYLPKSSVHLAKTKKLVNCGVVGFTLQVGRDANTGRPRYRISQESLRVVYGGFEVKK